MEQPKKRRLIRKKPVVDDYCYGPYSREEDKYSPSDIISTRIQQRIEKEKFYSTFCPPVIYDFMNDKDITQPRPIITVKDIVEPQSQQQIPVKSGFSIIPADKLREVQREVSRDSRDTQRDYRSDKRDSRDTHSDYRSDKRDSADNKRDYRNDKRDSRDTQSDHRDTQRDYRSDKRDYRDTQRDYRNDKHDYRKDKRDSRDTQRDYRNDKRDSRETSRDNDYHRNRDRGYERTARNYDAPNPYNGTSYKSSKGKMELDNELGKYCRKF